MNRPFTPADNEKRFIIGTARGRLEFPVTDFVSTMPPNAGILWLDEPYALGPRRISWLYVTPAEVEPVLKGLRVEIFKHPMFASCSNGGVSEAADSALLVGDIITKNGGDVFEVHDNDVVLVAEPWHGGWRAVPYLPPGEPRPWFMAGGAFAYTSDSRFPRVVWPGAPLGGWSAPIAIHDRVER